MTLTIIPPDQGPKYWLVGDQINFKVTGERTDGAFAMAENYITPQHGPPPHVHHREHECYYVLSGQFFFASGATAFVVGAGAAVFLPKDVPHVFKNVGPTPGKFLLMAVPAGFETMVMEAGQAIDCIPFDKTVSPNDIQKLLAVCPRHNLELKLDWNPAAPAEPPTHDRKLWVLGQHVTIKLTSAESNGALSLAEVASQPGEGVPSHSHRAVDEVFYILESNWEFIINGQTTPAPPGTTIHIPRGVMHSFKNVGLTRGRLVDYHLPGGFEQFFEDAGVEAADDNIPPKLPPPDMPSLIALFDKHGMDVPA